MIPWGINPSFPGLFPWQGQVPYAFRTRAPVAGRKASFSPLPLDLHVLGLPLAFILSQDQTLHCISLNVCPTPGNPSPPHQNGSFLNSTLSLQYVYELLCFFFLPNPTSRPFGSALPYQLSGCKYTHVIWSPQNVFAYFFWKKIN